MNGLKTKHTPEIQNKENPVQKEQKFPPENGVRLTAVYSGPIPPPDHLAAYEKIVPGIAKQFLEEPHREAEHRRSLEVKMVDAQIRLASQGQTRAFLLACICLPLSFITIYLGYPLGGLSGLFLSIGILVSVFIYSKTRKSSRS
jgi:uncharacterized membrane protein